MHRLLLITVCGFALSLHAFHTLAAAPAQPVTTKQAAAAIADDDKPDIAKAERMIAKAIEYLRGQQHASGGWSINEGGPNFPAITGLVVDGMMMQPGVGAKDPAVVKGIDYMLSMQQADGGIYDKILPSYNTAITVMTLAKVEDPKVRSAVDKAIAYLKGLQYGEGAIESGQAEGAERVPPSHPYYGGFGYGNRGRPDISNTGFAIEAMHNAGIDGDDPAMQRAVKFLERIQMVERYEGMPINDMPYAKGSTQGGFIYATSVNKDEQGVGQSFAGEIEETLSDGTTASRLRAYGSVSYVGFKSYIYADLRRDDPRVRAVLDWMRHHYTVEENPGIGTDGFYYYIIAFSKALDAWGEPTIETVNASGGIEHHNWRHDLIERLAELQNEDGSFKSIDDRWMENNPVLITAYSLVALQHAVRD